MSIMKKLMLAIALAGCGPNAFSGTQWSESRPVYIRITDDVPMPAESIRRSITEGLSQFGISVTSEQTGAYEVSVERDPDCVCSKCGQYTAAWVSPYSFQVIRVCDRTAVLVKDLGADKAADVSIKHELGHVLGFDEHLDPGTDVLMSALIDKRLNVRKFGVADIEAICNAGGVLSKACR